MKNKYPIILTIFIVVIVLVFVLVFYLNQKTTPPLPPIPQAQIPKLETPKYVDIGKIIELNIFEEPYNIKIKTNDGKIYTAIIDSYTYIRTSQSESVGKKGLTYLKIDDEVSFNSKQGALKENSPFLADSIIIQGTPLFSDPKEIFTLEGKVKVLKKNSFTLILDDKEITVNYDENTKVSGGALKAGAKVIVNNPLENLKDKDNIYAKYIEVL